MGRCAAAVLEPLLLLLAAAVGAAAWGLSAPAAPRFAVVPKSHMREGKGYLDALQAESSTEGFLDRLFGTNCFSAAVGELNTDCRHMDQDTKTRLALRLMNCQLVTQGSDSFPCNPRQRLKECTEALPQRAYLLFVEFLTHADTMCLFIQNQNFEKYTENMLNRLAEGAGFAQEQLTEAARSSAALRKETGELQKKAEAALGMLRQHGEMEQESLKLQKKARAEALAYYMSLDAKQQQGLEMQDQALQKQAALEAGQASVLQQLSEAQGHVKGLFDLVEGRAAELEAAAARQAEAQRALAGELGALADSSAGIRSAVDVVIGYQQRSDSVLMRLLGKSYSLEDVAFYAAGALAAMAAGVSPATARAKLPVFALLGVSLLGERLLINWLHMWMDIGENGEVVLSLPAWGWLPFGSAAASSAGASPAGQALWQFSFKWAVRRMAVVLGAAIMGYCWLSHRDYEREGYFLLRQMEEQQRQRHEEYLALIKRQKVELAAMLGGAGAGAGEGGASGRVGGRTPTRVAVDAAVGPDVGLEGGLAPAVYASTAGQLVVLGAAGLGQLARRLPTVLEEAGEDEEGEGEGAPALAGVQQEPGPSMLLARGRRSFIQQSARRSYIQQQVHQVQQAQQLQTQAQQEQLPPQPACPPQVAADVAAPAAPAAAAVAPTPAARERGGRGVTPPARPRSASQQQAASEPAGRKRGPSDEEAAPTDGSKRRAASSRRRSGTADASAGISMETEGGLQSAGKAGKRSRRGAADEAAPQAGGAGVSAAKRARRK